MKTEEGEVNLKQYRLFLPIYLTIQVTTLVLTLLQLPNTIAFYRDSLAMQLGPWLGFWLVLLIIGIGVGIKLSLFSKSRKVFIEKRMNLIFGYLGGAWAGLLTLGFQIPFQPLYFYITAALGLIWWIFFTVLRKNKRAHAIFP